MILMFFIGFCSGLILLKIANKILDGIARKAAYTMHVYARAIIITLGILNKPCTFEEIYDYLVKREEKLVVSKYIFEQVLLKLLDSKIVILEEGKFILKTSAGHTSKNLSEAYFI